MTLLIAGQTSGGMGGMKFDRIVVLTGAGLSAESGFGTFRGREGLWDEYDIEDVATPEGFARNPVKVHSFYNMRRGCLKDGASLFAQTHYGRKARTRSTTRGAFAKTPPLD